MPFFKPHPFISPRAILFIKGKMICPHISPIIVLALESLFWRKNNFVYSFFYSGCEVNFKQSQCWNGYTQHKDFWLMNDNSSSTKQWRNKTRDIQLFIWMILVHLQVIIYLHSCNIKICDIFQHYIFFVFYMLYRNLTTLFRPVYFLLMEDFERLWITWFNNSIQYHLFL